MIKILPDFESYEEVNKFIESKEFEELSDKDALEILDTRQRLFYKENSDAFKDIPKLEEALEIPEYLEALKE